MQRQDFFFELPEKLIAQRPADKRSASRLLCVNGETGAIDHKNFTELPDLLNAGDLLILNNTKVIPARLYGHRLTGGKVEVMLDQIVDDKYATAHLRASNTPKIGTKMTLPEGNLFVAESRDESIFHLRLEEGYLSWYELCEKYGQMPLPPYIEREEDADDYDRYHTVYGQHLGSVAAPTAGLHFDDEVFERLKEKGVEVENVMLHIGAGTFLPVRKDNIFEHRMHSEYLEVTQDICDKIKATKERGGRVVAVGTTSVRSLETAALSGELKPYKGSTDIFIYPGFEFKVVDVLVTNFHLPESTLIMLVSAFGGYKNVMNAYKQAVEEAYRFFSYGDSMFITCNLNPDKP